MLYGSGDFVYELKPDWAKLPAGWEWNHTSGAAVDANDNVVVFNRSAHPVMIFDPEGNLLRTWGEGVFSRPHGVFITPDQFVWGSDDLDHTIRKFDLQGNLLETMGTKGQPSDSGYVRDGSLAEQLRSIKRGAGPFNRPTKLVVAPWGERYVSDGYGNARVHRFTASGDWIGSWGEPGTGPGEFNLPHGLAIDPRGRVLVADRENSRVQIFTKDGKFLDQWTDLHTSGDVAIDKDGVVYISERPGRVCIKDLDGKNLCRFSGEEGQAMRNTHSLCVDSRGNIYTCEIALGSPTIKKLVRQ